MVIIQEVVYQEEIEKYTKIPIAFENNSKYDVKRVEGEYRLTEQHLAIPNWKNYDDYENPNDWARRFDTSNWGMLIANRDNIPVGGAVIAIRTPGLDMLENRNDLAVLFDIRIAPVYRGMGIGRKLFTECERWARTHGCVELKIETQNNNVPACKFYKKMGCELKSVIPGAYKEFPDEVMMLWHKIIT